MVFCLTPYSNLVVVDNVVFCGNSYDLPNKRDPRFQSTTTLGLANVRLKYL